MDRISRNAVANIHRTAAVQTIHRLVATTTMDADVNTKNTDAAQTKSRRPKDLNSKDAVANTINSVAAPMASRLHKDHTTMVAIVCNANTNAVPTALRQRLGPTSKDAPAPPANTAAAPMASPTPKDRNSKDALRFRLNRKRLAASQRTAALAAITRSNTSSIWNTEVARDSGIAVAMETTIATIRSKSANQRAKPRPERTLVCCPKFTDHALATILSITTILIATLARNSFMVVAWAIPIDSKRSRNVKNYAKSTNHCVSWDEHRSSIIENLLRISFSISLRQHPANNRWKLANATDNSNAGLTTKSKILARASHTPDARATRTTLPPKKPAPINARDQELAKVSDA